MSKHVAASGLTVHCFAAGDRARAKRVSVSSKPVQEVTNSSAMPVKSNAQAGTITAEPMNDAAQITIADAVRIMVLRDVVAQTSVAQGHERIGTVNWKSSMLARATAAMGMFVPD